MENSSTNGVGSNVVALDTVRLLALARDRSIAGREMLAGSISDLFRRREHNLSPEERGQIDEILRLLVRDVERSVRRALAESLADHPGVPPDVVRALANDTIEVAHPILVDSPVLTDPDLIEIVRQKSFQHRLAIAMRVEVSEPVCGALVDAGEPEVAACLLNNRGARISHRLMERLVDRARHDTALHTPLVGREDLGPELAMRLAAAVSGALREDLIRRHGLAPDVVDANLPAAAHTAAGGDAMQAGGIGPLPNARALTTSALVLLRRGDIVSFEAAMIAASGLEPRMLRRLLYDQEGQGLAVICRATEMPKADFAAIFLLTRRARPSADSVKPATMASLLAAFDRLPVADAKAALARWRREARLR